MQHSEQKKTEKLKTARKAIAGEEFPLLEYDIMHMTRCSTIWGEDANIRWTSLGPSMGGIR
jgi:hypothetical protein